VSGEWAAVGDVSEWIATKPWVAPFGRIAVVFKDIPALVQTAIMASLATVAFYELMVHVGRGYVCVASVDPQKIGIEYALFPTREEVLSRVEA
jgi:hypothetical protein